VQLRHHVRCGAGDELADDPCRAHENRVVVPRCLFQQRRVHATEQANLVAPFLRVRDPALEGVLEDTPECLDLPNTSRYLAWLQFDQ
jgi:hypothetical protein